MSTYESAFEHKTESTNVVFSKIIKKFQMKY